MIKIKYLCEYPGHLAKASQLWCDTIGHTWRPDITFAEIETRFSGYLNRDALPLMYIALDGEEVVGMCSLKTDDSLDSGYFPWLSSLAVEESYRKRGIGKLLMKVICDKARSMGFQKVYLFTLELELVTWYEGNGWTKIEECPFREYVAHVMEKVI